MVDVPLPAQGAGAWAIIYEMASSMTLDARGWMRGKEGRTLRG